MSDFLYIDGNSVELSSSIAIPITFSIADFKAPENRKRSSSKTIQIEGTIVNKRIFSSAYNLSLTDDGTGLGFSIDPTIRKSARVVRNGKEIFNGLCRLLEVTLDNGNYTFEVVLFSDFVNVIKRLGDVTVGELGWEEYNHVLNKTNIENSWSASVIKNGVATSNYTSGKPDGFGYWYPIIDYGYNSSLVTFNLNDLYTYVYFKEILEKAFALLGYTISSDFIDSDMFKALVYGFGGGEKEMLPPLDASNRGLDYDFDGTKTLATSGIKVIDDPNPSNPDGYQYNSSSQYGLDKFTGSLISDGYSQYSSTNGKIKIRQSGSYKLNLDFDILVRGLFSVGSLSASDTKIRVEVYKNGSFLGSTPYQVITSGSYVNYTKNQDFFLSLSSGDEIEIKTKVITVGLIYSVNSFTFTTDLNLNSDFNVILTSENGIYLEGDTVSLSRFLPQLKVSEFVKGVINMFGLYVDEPNEENEIKIEPLEDFYLDNDQSENWTEILDYSKKVSIKSPTIDSSKNYLFEFAEDKDTYNQIYLDKYGIGYGNYNFTSSNEYNSKETVYRLPFSQSVPVAEPMGGGSYVIPRIVNIDSVTNLVKPHKGKPRVFFNNGLIAGQFSIRDSSGLNNFTTYPQAHHSFGNIKNPTFDLNFSYPEELFYYITHRNSENLFNNYHRINIEELTDKEGKILKAYFKLDDSLITKDMFRRLVNINGVLYRKNLIVDYDATGYETTRVELYKALETTELIYPTVEVVPRIPDRNRPILISSSPREDRGSVLGSSKVINGGRNSPSMGSPIYTQLRQG